MQIPKTSSKDRLTAVLEDLKEVLKHSHPNTSFLDKGTTTNTTIEKLDTILGPPKKYHNDLSRVIRVESPRVLRNNQPPRVAQTNQQQLATIAEEPTIYPSGTIIRKKIGRTLQIGTVTRYDDDREYYWINYKNGDSEEMQHQFVTKYKCIEPDILQRRSNWTQQKANSITETPSSTQLAYAVYDEETGKMLDMWELRNQPNQKTREEWDRSVSNEYGRLMKGIGMKKKRRKKLSTRIQYLPLHTQGPSTKRKKKNLCQILLWCKTPKRREK